MKRLCLRCQHLFGSKGNFNRICKQCRKDNFTIHLRELKVLYDKSKEESYKDDPDAH